jgi:hypothetical protein
MTLLVRNLAEGTLKEKTLWSKASIGSTTVILYILRKKEGCCGGLLELMFKKYQSTTKLLRIVM